MSAPQKTMAELAAEYGLAPNEYQVVLDRLGREPNQVELGVFSVMWSEHCSYKSSKIHLGKFPTKGPRVICGPGENAGVIDIDDGDACIFKMESHNHPSFIEPYQGAATGVGGIMRDVFTMGARPVALLNALRFGDPSHEKSKRLVKGVVAGIGGYGNCVGVPTVAGETNFHKGYNGNILVNAMCVGLARADEIYYSAAPEAGHDVVYFGSKTGRDGIHGATMSSTEFTEDSEEKRPTVQVGDPFAEKLLIEATLELMASGAVAAIQDMGAAGLTSSSVEMAGKGGVGVELDLDKVPQRETGMTAYEMMLSESQERMLMVLKPGREAFAEAIFKKWELDFAVIGHVTDTGRMVLEHKGEIVCDIPLAPLADDAPLYDRPSMPKDEYKIWSKVEPLGEIAESTDIGADLVTLMGSPDIASRRWIWEQYDHMVGADTVQRPGGDAAVVRVHGSRKGIAISTDCTPRYCYADPYEGGKQAIAECYRNLSAVGSTPLAVTNCLNFANPQRPEIMAQLTGCLEGMGDACRAFDFPIVSGNVSLYNESKATGGGSAILPTPAIGGIGLLADIDVMATVAFKNEGDAIWLVGGEGTHLGQSIWLREIAGREAGDAPKVDLAVERANGDAVRALVVAGTVNAVHDISDGGLIVTIAEMALAGKIGATLDVALSTASAFGEDQSRYVVTAPAGVEIAGAVKIGTVGGDSVAGVSIDALRTAHEGFFPALMDSEL